MNFQDNLWAAFEAQFFPTPLFPLTVDEDHVVGTQDGGNLFNGPLSFGENTFTSGDDIFAFGDHNVLKATFNGSANVFSVEVWDVQKWIIDQTNGGEGKFAWDFNTIDIESKSAGFGGHIIQGLKTVDFHDDSTAGTLLIGNNPEPVQELGGTADGFTIIVHQAIGTGHNGVDVDIDASAFNNPRGDTIFVIADVVGGFPTHNGSYVVPDPIKVARHDGDDYDPNWQGYLGDAFAIASGASAGPDGPPPGAVGFTIWDVTSVGAAHARSLNIIALGGEGSTSAHIINLADDGSNTMLFATSKSDSLSTDWENVSHIDLSETSGFVTLTGLETDMDGVHGHRSEDTASTPSTRQPPTISLMPSSPTAAAGCSHPTSRWRCRSWAARATASTTCRA